MHPYFSSDVVLMKFLPLPRRNVIFIVSVNAPLSPTLRVNIAQCLHGVFLTITEFTKRRRFLAHVQRTSLWDCPPYDFGEDNPTTNALPGMLKGPDTYYTAGVKT